MWGLRCSTLEDGHSRKRALPSNNGPCLPATSKAFRDTSDKKEGTAVRLLLLSGVPQGSNLGPLLFLMYINDISEEIGVEFCLFADDLKVYKPIKSVEDCCQMQQTLNNLHRWCEQNKLRFNISKCFAMTVSLKKLGRHRIFGLS